MSSLSLTHTSLLDMHAICSALAACTADGREGLCVSNYAAAETILYIADYC